jgi:hypothetical protein
MGCKAYGNSYQLPHRKFPLKHIIFKQQSWSQFAWVRKFGVFLGGSHSESHDLWSRCQLDTHCHLNLTWLTSLIGYLHKTLVSHHIDLSLELLDFPHNMTADFPQIKWLNSEQGGNLSVSYGKLYAIVSTLSYWSHRPLYSTWKGPHKSVVIKGGY